ncbi:MAG TPA: CPBP family intramembrane glutamate endopeptidase, partial [Bradyrhizobium sp.]|nr:CPBP family intramembrane glutamate endopeptidase [Bradyrhizobium sp.]
MSSSETPTLAADTLPLASHPPRIWKFWGTCLWGVLLFAAMFAGQFLLVVAFFLAKGPPFDLASIKAVASAGTVISLSVMMGLPAVLAVLWLATRMARMPFAGYLALRRSSWRNLLIGITALIVLIAGWELLSRMLGREISPGFMVEVLKSA